jgi:glycosyltransferase involved in cell wall biosynthesis
MPLNNYIGKKNIDRVLPLLSKEELWASEHFTEPEVVLNRIQPDISITCNVNTFRPLPRFAKDVVQIVDLCGPVHFEHLLAFSTDGQTAATNGPMLEELSKATVEKLRAADYVVTVSERQKYFWAAYCSLAGFSFADLNLLVCPASFETLATQRNPSPQISVVHCGGFYPWQSPNRFLEKAASVLDKIPGATLHVFGGAHQGLANEADVARFLTELQRHPSVRCYGYCPIEEVRSKLSQAWCALELMERNIERELAITGRMFEFLSNGTPVIYNNYSTLSRLIEQYGAGWAIPVEGEPPLDLIFNQLTERGLPFVEEISSNARRLVAEEFSAEKSIAPLVQLCGAPELSKRPSTHSAKKTVALQAQNGTNGGMSKRESLGRVLVIAPATSGALLELRVTNPLRALHRQGLIDGITVAGPFLHELQHDNKNYDVILTQRSLPRPTYEVLQNLSLSFVLDIDDNLLARASYRTDEPEVGVATGLRLCQAVTLPNPRLLRALERYTGLPLASKAFITPNALPFPNSTSDQASQPPSQILWIQSDIAALDQSRETIISAVERFSKAHELPVVLIGKNVLSRPQFTHQVVMGEIDFTANLQLLASAPLSMGVAPLETQSDRETLDMIAGKSDLKILLFAGYGHCGVYSAAPPYTDSKLQRGLSVVDNSAAEWDEALQYEFREGWKRISGIAQQIQAERNVDKVARENWLPGLEAARLKQPITGAALYETFRSWFDIDPASVNSLYYLAANDDVLWHCMVHEEYTASKHYAEHGLRESRRLRHDLEAQRELTARIEYEASAGIVALGKELERLTEQAKYLGHGARRLTEEKEELTKQLMEEKKELSKQLLEKEELSRTLTGVLNSKSWRVTAPLRNLRGRR